MDHFKNFVDDNSIKVGGKKHILTNYNYMIPVTIDNILPCMPLSPYTDEEWLTSLHVVLTSDVDWDPTFLDSSGSVDNKSGMSLNHLFPKVFLIQALTTMGISEILINET